MAGKVKITETYAPAPDGGEIVVRWIDPGDVDGRMIGQPVPMRLVSRKVAEKIWPKA